METRAATVTDACALAGVHRAAAIARYSEIFPVDVAPPTLAQLTAEWDELVARAAVALVAVETGASGESVIGGIVIGVDATVPTGWTLHRLYVRPDRWANGAGSMLHDAALASARDMGVRSLNLWVLAENVTARRFYERRGWRLVSGRVLHNDPSDIVDVLYEYRNGRSRDHRR